MGLTAFAARLACLGAVALAACSTVPYEALDLRDSATLPSLEVRGTFSSADEGPRMYAAASAIGAEGSDTGSIGAGQRISLGGTVIDGPADWRGDFELRCVSFLLGVQVPFESVTLETAVGVAGIGAQLDLSSNVDHARADLDFTALALAAALQGPILDWLDWRVGFDVAVGSESTLTRAEALLVARPFGCLRLQAGIGTLQFARTDAGGSDIELGLTGPRVGVVLQF